MCWGVARDQPRTSSGQAGAMTLSHTPAHRGFAASDTEHALTWTGLWGFQSFPRVTSPRPLRPTSAAWHLGLHLRCAVQCPPQLYGDPHDFWR